MWASVPVSAIPPTASFDFTPPTTITINTALSATSTSTVCCPSGDTIMHERWRLTLLNDPTPDSVGPDTTTVLDNAHFFPPDVPGSTYNFMVPDDGEYRLALKVWDEDPETDETFVDFTVSNIRPSADFSISPTAPTTTDTITATDASSDADGVIVDHEWKLRLLFDPTPDGVADTPGIVDTQSGGTSYAFTVPDDGRYRVELTVTDDDGEARTRLRAFDVGNVPPAGAMLDINPELVAHKVGDNIRYDDLSDQAFPDVDGVLTTAEFSDSDGFFDTDVAGGFAAKALGPGPCARTVTLTVYDDDGDSASVSRDIIVDGSIPTTAVSLPSTSSGWYDDDVTATISRADTCSGVDWTMVELGGERTYVNGGKDFAWEVEGDGRHTMKVQSRDVARNIEKMQTFGINIDGSAPDVMLSEPCTVGIDLVCSTTLGGVFLSGDPVLLEATANDALSGVASVDFFVDGGLVASFGPGAGTYSTMWTAQGFGPHLVEAVVTDVAGNSASDAVVITVLE